MGEFITLPWVTTLVSILMITIAIYLTFDIFEMKSLIEMVFLSGVYVTNITITSYIATYLHDFAGSMIALALSVYVVFLWKKLCIKFNKKDFILSVLSISFLLGFYQAFLSVTIVLVIIYSVVKLLHKNDSYEITIDGLKAILIIVLGFTIYIFMVNVSCFIIGVELQNNSYNSLSNLWKINTSILKKLILAYSRVAFTFIAPTYQPLTSNLISIFSPNIYNTFLYVRTLGNVLLISLDAICLVIVLFYKEIRRSSKFLIILLIIILPIGMEISSIGSDVSHDLMHFSYWLFYLLSWLLIKNTLIEGNCKNRKTMFIVASSISIFFICNIQASNMAYVKKEMIKDSTLSIMTRVLNKIEEMEDFDQKNTPVAFIGVPDANKEIDGTQMIDGITGIDYNFQITFEDGYRSYFKNVLHYEINICNTKEIEVLKNNSEVKKMPVFPKKGSIKSIKGVIVVKLSDIK